MDSPTVRTGDIEELLEDVQTVLNRVRRERQQDRYDIPLQLLQVGAIEPLEKALESLNRGEERLTETTRELRHRVARKLADCHGSRGGLYRRQGRWAEALRCYDQGRAIEQDPKYGIVDSYNLTNALIASLFVDPANLRQRADAFREAAETVAQQVNGDRRDSYWALADLGLLLLLCGRPAEARERAYAKYRSLGPHPVWKMFGTLTEPELEEAKYRSPGAIPTWAYTSTLEVLVECRDQLKGSEPDLAVTIDDAITFLRGGSA